MGRGNGPDDQRRTPPRHEKSRAHPPGSRSGTLDTWTLLVRVRDGPEDEESHPVIGRLCWGSSKDTVCSLAVSVSDPVNQ